MFSILDSETQSVPISDIARFKCDRPVSLGMNIDSLSKILKMTGANDSLKIRHQTDSFRKNKKRGEEGAKKGHLADSLIGNRFRALDSTEIQLFLPKTSGLGSHLRLFVTIATRLCTQCDNPQ